MDARIFDSRVCELGEGAFWHPLRQQFFWFDILGRCLRSRLGGQELEWAFDRIVSAAGWVDVNRLLIASETGLFLFNLETGVQEPVAAVEADQPATRSNDGRADRQGGFWFGTMGKQAQKEAGAIYRFYRGEVRKLYSAITIPNAICFAPDGRTAYFADTRLATVWTQALDHSGWPVGERQVFLDLSGEGLNPDGAVVAADGSFWCAKWGSAAVMSYTPDGQRSGQVAVGGLHASCPAFGGPALDEMLVTTAREGIAAPDAGQGVPYLVHPGVRGLPEPQVIL
jgi:sugar lactone lactonase YvrE